MLKGDAWIEALEMTQKKIKKIFFQMQVKWQFPNFKISRFYKYLFFNANHSNFIRFI